MIRQYHLFSPTPREPPLVVAYGLGVDSTAMLIGLAHRGIRPDLILFADVGGEKPETYLYAPIFRQWLRQVDFLQFEVVRYPVAADSRQVDRTKRIVGRVWEAIPAGSFYPSPSPIQCPSCLFQRAYRQW